LSFLDLGIGNSLINRVAAASATGNTTVLRQTIARGLLLLSAIGLVVGAALLLLLVWIPLERLIKVGSTRAAEAAARASKLLILLYAASIPLSGVSRVFQGLQRAWLSHVARGVGSILSVVLVYFLAKVQASPTGLLLATYGVQVFMPLVLVVVLWRERLFGS